MSLDEALDIVKDRYGLGETYVDAKGKMLFVVKAEQQLRAMPEVIMPGRGIALYAPEVIELARGATTIDVLVRRKNPELFKPA